MNASRAGDERMGELLAGGNVGRVWRVGDTVRREPDPGRLLFTDCLRHLLGMPEVPRFRGLGEHGREVLDHLPGRIVDVDREVLTDTQLIATGVWTRHLHEATRSS